MNHLKKIAGAILALLMTLCIMALSVTACANLSGGPGGGAAIIFTTPVKYREMVLATPSVDSTVTITGNAAYDASDNDTLFSSGRTVILSPFKIAKYETTYELWYEVYQWATDVARGANGYIFANPGREGKDGTDGAAPTAAKLEPVTTINWRDAIVWCNAYSEMSGKEPVYYTDTSYGTVLRISTNDSGTGTAADTARMKSTANGYRLPTEAQWEYTARGGGTPSTSGSFADTWAGTNTKAGLTNYAWYSVNSGSTTNAVGGRTANTLGLHDMGGNVWEWCWDWYGSTGGTGEEDTNPAGANSGTDRVLRGGSWNGSASSCAVSFRDLNYPGYGYYDLGFRVVCP
ncbi:MAG: formylglycine-generating enzyme family protein [Spirochaetaceae bacterium]|jgi:formylglycine-generating enzyme required for sulfatase activity|nr:formylglycine-generating enzyme family protein [Spirochaetaceae bacterium]